MRQQFPNPAIGLGWQAFEHILQIREGLMAVEPRGLDQAHDRSGTLARPQATREQPVLAPERNRPDLVLDSVVVDGHTTITHVVREGGRALEAVIDSAGNARAVGNLGAPLQEPRMQTLKDGTGLRLS